MKKFVSIVQYIYYRTATCRYFDSLIVPSAASPAITVLMTFGSYLFSASFIYSLCTNGTSYYNRFLAFPGTKVGVIYTFFFLLIAYSIIASIFLHYHPDKPRVKYIMRNPSNTINDETIDKFIGESRKQRFRHGIMIILFYLIGWSGVICIYVFGDFTPVGLEVIFGLRYN